MAQIHDAYGPQGWAQKAQVSTGYTPQKLLNRCVYVHTNMYACMHACMHACVYIGHTVAIQ